MTSPAENVGYGQGTPWDWTDQHNIIDFIVRMRLARISTIKVVRVEAVHPGAGDPPAPGTVDVLPLINQLDGAGNKVEHGTIHGIPVWRMQAGPWSVVAQPAVGDIGIMLCCDRDISVLKANADGKQANPGSYRTFDYADGIYLGGILNPVSAATLQLKGDGSLKLTDQHGNVLETSAAGFSVTTGGDFLVNGISVTQHVHPITTAPGTSGPPAP